MKVILYALCAGLLALSIAVAYQFNALAQQRHYGRTANLQTWHTVICFLEKTTVSSKKGTVAQKEQAILFWDHVLERISAPPCT